MLTTFTRTCRKTPIINFGRINNFILYRGMFRSAARFLRRAVPPEERPRMVREAIIIASGGAAGGGVVYALTKPSAASIASQKAVADAIIEMHKKGITVRVLPQPPTHPDVQPLRGDLGSSPASSSSEVTSTFSVKPGDTIMRSIEENIININDDLWLTAVSYTTCGLGFAIFLTLLWRISLIKISDLPPEIKNTKLKGLYRHCINFVFSILCSATLSYTIIRLSNVITF